MGLLDSLLQELFQTHCKMPEPTDSLIANTKRRMKSNAGATEEIWKEMVYNKDITNDKVIDAYKVWAEAYDKDFAIVHPNRAEHMAVYLDELVTQYGMKKENLKILDVAAGTGLVGEELKKRGFNPFNITALDLCPDCPASQDGSPSRTART